MAIKQMIEGFLVELSKGEIEIYNEFSLQHELGIYLRNQLSSDYKVQFERNVSSFRISGTAKSEIDIVVLNSKTNEKYAIELKFPLNGQYPEQMYSFVKDLKFMEELKEHGFTHTYSLVIVSDSLFYQGDKQTDIYKHFRKEQKIYGTIQKPTGQRNTSITINQTYPFEWISLAGRSKYYLIEV